MATIDIGVSIDEEDIHILDNAIVKGQLIIRDITIIKGDACLDGIGTCFDSTVEGDVHHVIGWLGVLCYVHWWRNIP